jgi:signal transduction histidine kinase
VDAWLSENGALVAASAAALAVLALVLLVLWLRARAAALGAAADAAASRELEYTIAEQNGRLRIIRELHEVAARNVGGILTEASGARVTIERDPAAALRAIDALERTARSTLADMRRVLTIVRDSEADAAAHPAQRTLRDLLGVHGDAGLDIRFEEDGSPFALEQGAELAIFRILQEALSNALKHGGDGTEVRVAFTWTGDGLRLQVDDDGERVRRRAAGEDLAGYDVRDDVDALTRTPSGPGLAEMRERTELFGGVFSAVPVPGIGFSISAVFPTLKHHNGVHGVQLTGR